MRKFYGFFRWTARIFSLVMILATIAFFVGEGIDFSNIVKRDVTLFVFFPLGLVVGFVIAWWKELPGGLIAVLSASFLLPGVS